MPFDPGCDPHSGGDDTQPGRFGDGSPKEECFDHPGNADDDCAWCAAYRVGLRGQAALDAAEAASMMRLRDQWVRTTMPATPRRTGWVNLWTAAGTAFRGWWGRSPDGTRIREIERHSGFAADVHADPRCDAIELTRIWFPDPADAATVLNGLSDAASAEMAQRLWEHFADADPEQRKGLAALAVTLGLNRSDVHILGERGSARSAWVAGHGVAGDGGGEDGHGDQADGGDQVEARWVDGVAEEASPVGQDEDEDQDDGATKPLRTSMLMSCSGGDPWGEGDAGADEDEGGEEPEERGRFPEASGGGAFGADGFGDGVGGCQRDDDGGEGGGAQEADAEERLGEVPGHGAQRLGGGWHGKSVRPAPTRQSLLALALAVGALVFVVVGVVVVVLGGTRYVLGVAMLVLVVTLPAAASLH